MFCNICFASQIYDDNCGWPRDLMRCVNCDSMVRQRALVYVLNLFEYSLIFAPQLKIQLL